MVAPFRESDASEHCATCDEPVAKKAMLCPYCGMLLRPNYAVILVTAGVWFAGLIGFAVWFVLSSVL